MCIHCRVIAFLSADTSHDLDLCPFDLVQLSCMASHVTNLATKHDDPTPIRSWVTSCNISHWLPLKMRMRSLHMCRITWPMSRGWNTITRPRFAYSLYNFGGSTMNMIKVICENNTRPCVKKRMRFCACAKSRDLLKGALNVLLQSFSSTSIYSIGLQKLSI